MSERNEDNLSINFSAFGVNIGIEVEPEINFDSVSKKILTMLRANLALIERNEIKYLFEVKRSPHRGFTLLKNGQHFHTSGTTDLILEHLESQIRLTIAEFAERKVFLHAGVVGWKDRAIIIPGRSYYGKTTLVSAFVKKGAEYFSDEYAVLDENGFVHPFPKMLSLRGIVDTYRQLDVPVEEIGGIAAKKEIPVGMILLTRYKPGSEWKPEKISLGECIIELIPHTIPITNNPQFSLDVLNKVVNRAQISKSDRGEADVFADIVLEHFEKIVM